ncbi:uncharacterized protein TM35_000131880 [Trypanosoma theileri]|uniref:Calponin-homology (CH) domain-containing protein n=1 Tax=Trypanosoma theileri TaxID=67003 RepID=A0A1X0NWV1_9TRYP|nr:uncharacterized protein TM35_000131880 [Trypanosoma theileri]ORC89184.1 hypothetical protein TM35_000131880 [Trypanosoma theileri]
MPGGVTKTHPSGRGELLLWINSVCSAEYPSVESLRDGVAYCTVVDAAVNRVAENCKVLGLQSAHSAQSRARRSSQLLGRLDWDVTLTTCTNQDPSLDSLQERGQCEKNIQILQLMLRSCVPPELSLEIDISRLASGKLQEHIMLLKWTYQFMTKMLNTYSRSALERRVSNNGGTGCVEGVRMTRTMKLQQKMVREKYSELSPLELASEKLKNNEIGKDTGENYKVITGKEKGDVNEPVGSDPFLNVKYSVASSIENREDIVPESQSLHSRKMKRYCNDPSKQVLLPDAKSNDICSSSIDYMQFSSLAVPNQYYSILNDLRRDIESYEEFVLAAHRRHQQCLTSSQTEEEDYASDYGFLVEELLPKKAPIISLEQLGVLLEERDKLWQTLEVLHDAIAQCAFVESKENRTTITSSPLMMKILSVLSIS